MQNDRPRASRRSFLRHSSAALAGAALLTTEAPARSSGRSGAPLRVALVGCGGRGTGATAQALRTAQNVELVAMADAFRDRLDTSYGELTKHVPEQLKVREEHKFVGFDAYRRAIDCEAGVDVVVLATPPGFRPPHFEYAVERDKHVFMEKPVAVDAAGVRRVLAAAEVSKRKNLKVGVGLQRHHSDRYIETVRRIQEGAIGQPVLLRCYWNGAGVWTRPRTSGMTEMEYQMRNWYYFNWLCGDHIVEQHIHNLDVCNWIMKGFPVSAQGQGGRQVRTGLDTGEIYDHHMIEFTYADGTKMLSQCRHIPQCWTSVSEHAHGTAGIANVGAGYLRPTKGKEWEFPGPTVDAYQVEHDRLFEAIRSDRPHHEAEYGAKSTMTAIFGRMASYSGKVLEWDAALASERTLLPAELAWDANPPTLPDESGRYTIATPGITEVI